MSLSMGRGSTYFPERSNAICLRAVVDILVRFTSWGRSVSTQREYPTVPTKSRDSPISYAHER